MTKNILKSFFLVVLASLLLFSCTNVNDPTAVLNAEGKTYAMCIDAIVLKGLDASFNEKDVEVSFSYVTGYDKDGKATWKTEKSSFTTGKYGEDLLVFGAGFTKLATPIKIVAYENVKPEDAIVKVTAKVGDKNLKIAKSVLLSEFENDAKLSIVEADYPHRYLSIEAATNAIGGNDISSVFSLVETPKKNDYSTVIPFLKYWINSNIGSFETSSTDNITYTATIKYESEKDSWSKGKGNMEFGLTYAENNWDTKFTGAVLVVGGDFVALTKGAGENNKISGLVDGKEYVITVKVDSDGTLKAKIAEKK